MNVNSTTTTETDLIDLNLDEEFQFEDDIRNILLSDDSNDVQHSDDRKRTQTQQKHGRSTSSSDLKEKKRRRNVYEKLRTKKLNEEYANLANLFPTSSNLSKIETIKSAQEAIKDLRSKLELAEAQINKFNRHGSDKTEPLNDDMMGNHNPGTVKGSTLPMACCVETIKNAQVSMKELKSNLEDAQAELSKFYEITGVKTDLPNNNNANVANNTDAVENISEGFVFKHSGFPMSLLDVNGVVKFANPSFLKVTGFTQADVDDGKVGMFSMSSKEDLAQMYLNAGELICGGKQFVHFQKRCKIANEKYCTFHVSISTIRSNIIVNNNNNNDDNQDNNNNNSNSKKKTEIKDTEYFHCMILPDEECDSK
jgi:hypothetical protein